MARKLEDLVDLGLFQRLQDELNEIYSFPSAIIDNEGRVLTATAWQDLCTKFYRGHETARRECLASDGYILGHLGEAKPAVYYRCPHGLIDNAVPIVVDGEHLANFFTGQLFLSPPDLDFYRRQSVHYGFDEGEFLAAVARVPVWSQEKLDRYLSFIKTFTEILAGLGLRQLRVEEDNRRLAEARRELEASELRFRTIFECSRDAVGLSRRGVTVFMNRAYVELFGYSDPSELVGRPILECIAPSDRDRILENVRKRFTGEPLPDSYECRGLRKDGTEFDFEISVASFPDGEENLTLAVIRDISARKAMERELRSALEDRELLVRELYHRTKNNLNVVASYLQLEAMDSGDERLVRTVDRMVLRIRAMSLVHEKLYRARHLSSIGLGGYLSDLVASLAELHRRSLPAVEARVEAGDIEVLLDLAVPCGLVVNELVMNAFGHAFPGGGPGTILVRAARDGGGRLTLTVADDGVGLAPGRDLRREASLGLLSVFEIAERQLQAEIAYRGEGGLSWTISFDGHLYRERVTERSPVA